MASTKLVHGIIFEPVSYLLFLLATQKKIRLCTQRKESWSIFLFKIVISTNLLSSSSMWQCGLDTGYVLMVPKINHYFLPT